QQIAARTRLGIPVTFSSDPRHHFQAIVGASQAAGQFTQWPEALGLGAIGDAQTVRRFGDIVRREYRAVGIQMALFPQADLATEPRWPRLSGTSVRIRSWSPNSTAPMSKACRVDAMACAA